MYFGVSDQRNPAITITCPFISRISSNHTRQSSSVSEVAPDRTTDHLFSVPLVAYERARATDVQHAALVQSPRPRTHKEKKHEHVQTPSTGIQCLTDFENSATSAFTPFKMMFVGICHIGQAPPSTCRYAAIRVPHCTTYISSPRGANRGFPPYSLYRYACLLSRTQW